MQEKALTTPYRQLPAILFLFVETLTIGVFLALFLAAYLTFDEIRFDQRHAIFISRMKYVLPVGFLFLLFADRWNGWLRKKDETLLAVEGIHPNEILFFGGFLLISVLAVFQSILGIRVKILYFFSFLAALYALLSISRQYSLSPIRPAWRHPTSAGSVFEAALALGAAAGLWAYAGSSLEQSFAWLLVIILLFEGLTLWSRFNFLSRTDIVTHQAVAMMLNTHLMLFGVRFIFGMVMPLIYLLWSMLVTPLPPRPVVMMIGVGELSERILFFITAFPYFPTEAEQPGGSPATEPQAEEK